MTEVSLEQYLAERDSGSPGSRVFLMLMGTMGGLILCLIALIAAYILMAGPRG